MKLLKRFLIGIGILLVIFTVIGFIMPSEVYVERSKVIDAPVEMVYDQVNNLHNWEKWSPWHKIDPNMKLTYVDGGIGKGASYTWTSNHKSVGNGKLTIEDAKPFEYINTSMDFGENGTGTANFKFSPTAEGIKVTWDMRSVLGNNPFMRLMGVVIKKSIRAAYDRGLNDINEECEYLKIDDWYYVEVKEKPGWKYYGISNEKTTMETVQPLMNEYYGKLFEKLGKANIQLSGPAFSVYYSWGEEFHMECGLPVEDNSMEIKGIDAKEFAAATYAVLKLKGDYAGLTNAHVYLMEWLEKNELELVGPVIEKYKVGPESTQNPEEWVTYILYPVN